MSDPIDDGYLVELGFWVAVPPADGILANWGADVVKIEPPTGGPFRGCLAAGSTEIPIDPPFELENRQTQSSRQDKP